MTLAILTGPSGVRASNGCSAALMPIAPSVEMMYCRVFALAGVPDTRGPISTRSRMCAVGARAVEAAGRRLASLPRSRSAQRQSAEAQQTQVTRPVIAPSALRRPASTAACPSARSRAVCEPDVDLPRPRDLLLGVEQHLFPLRHPADRARDGEQHREHVHREAHRLIDQPGVEVDVRIELAADEVLVLERDPLELERDVEQRVLAGDLEHFVRRSA